MVEQGYLTLPFTIRLSPFRYQLILYCEFYVRSTFLSREQIIGNPCKIPGILSVRIGFSLFYWAIRWLGVRKIVRGKPIRKMTDFFLPAFYYLNA